MESCGTAEVTGVHSEVWPSSRTCCLLLVGKLSINFRRFLLTPMLSSLSSNLWCGTESNAFEKSVKMTCVLEALSRFCTHSWTVSSRRVWQEGLHYNASVTYWSIVGY